MILSKNSNCKIQVDGGVNILNAGKLVEFGADVLVAGNFIFKSDTPKENINSIKKI
jgi:ribulose-phosphate 3-epimerase